MSDIDTNTIDTAADATIAKVSPSLVVTQWVKAGLIVAALHYLIHQSLVTDTVEFGIGGAFMTWFSKQVAVAKTKPHPFTPDMFNRRNVAKVVTVAVAPVVAVLHFTIHQTLTTDAVEFGIGGAFVAWFFMLLCNPHLVDKIPELGETSDWDEKHDVYGLDISIANPDNWGAIRSDME